MEDLALSRSSIKSSWCLHFIFFNSWLSLFACYKVWNLWMSSWRDRGEGSLEVESGPPGFFAYWLVKWRWEVKPSPQ